MRSAHEADTAVVMSWLPGPLLGILGDLSVADIRVDIRVVIFPQELGAAYFSGVAITQRRPEPSRRMNWAVARFRCRIHVARG